MGTAHPKFPSETNTLSDGDVKVYVSMHQALLYNSAAKQTEFC